MTLESSGAAETGDDDDDQYTSPGEIPLACSVHPKGQITIVVEPSPPWPRLRWRLVELLER
jgi:hypothetical protein